MTPFNISNLQPQESETCNPPFTRIPRGRPKKEWIRLEDARALRGLRREELGTMDEPATVRLKVV